MLVFLWRIFETTKLGSLFFPITDDLNLESNLIASSSDIESLQRWNIGNWLQSWMRRFILYKTNPILQL